MQDSIVVSATDNFLVRLSQQNSLSSLVRAGVEKGKETYMFKLRRVRPLDVNKRGVDIDNTVLYKSVHLYSC